MLLVNPENLSSVFNELITKKSLSIDTETTGLYPHLGDTLFCITISSDVEDYYFDFNPIGGGSPWPIDDSSMLEFLRKLFLSDVIFYAHNAKFDMHFIKKAFNLIPKNIKDTEVLARLYDNSLLKYTLDTCVKWVGVSKGDEVKAYCDENGLTEMVSVPGKGSKEKRYYFHKVPFDIITKYACNDTNITLKLAHFLEAELLKADEIEKKGRALTYRIEEKLTQVLFDMESTGIKLNIDEATVNRDLNLIKVKDLEFFFEQETGYPLIDSVPGLTPVFNKYGVPLTGRTEKGAVSIDIDYLESVELPFAKIILDKRSYDKLAGTFYASYLYFQKEGRIHANFKQSGTATGRMSCSAPNLQQVSKDGGVRQLFTPTSSDYCLVMIDYDQMEYRVMLDLAKEMEMIKLVLSGLDVHTATAQLMGCSRSEAKTVNFLNIYGGGAQKLADTLRISIDKSKQLRSIYFKSLPHVSSWNRAMIDKAQRVGYVINWAGRKCRFPEPDFAYRAPNHFIQGGCADVVKRAMCKIHTFLSDKKSRMLLSIHDELVFEMHKDELHLVNDIKHIMETAYPHEHLPLTCGVEYSWDNWGDAIGATKDDEGRIEIKRKDSEGFKDPKELLVL